MNRFKGLVDVCAGRMSIKDVHREIDHYITYKYPKQLIVDIQREGNEYRTTFWMSEEDFLKGGQDETI